MRFICKLVSVLMLLFAITACKGQLASRSEQQYNSKKPPEYLGHETNYISSDLVEVIVAMRNPYGNENIGNYSECVTAQYILVRDYRYARRIRDHVEKKAGVWLKNTVYTLSKAKPFGTWILDAKLKQTECLITRIPMV